jgi:hypothetical protein
VVEIDHSSASHPLCIIHQLSMFTPTWLHRTPTCAVRELASNSSVGFADPVEVRRQPSDHFSHRQQLTPPPPYVCPRRTACLSLHTWVDIAPPTSRSAATLATHAGTTVNSFHCSRSDRLRSVCLCARASRSLELTAAVLSRRLLVTAAVTLAHRIGASVRPAGARR